MGDNLDIHKMTFCSLVENYFIRLSKQTDLTERYVNNRRQNRLRELGRASWSEDVTEGAPQTGQFLSC